MKKFVLFTAVILLSMFSSLAGQAQIFKTVNVLTAGTLSTALTSGELTNVTNLTVIGTLDDRDFKTMRDNMSALASLDLSSVNIAAYIGLDGTVPWEATTYPANELPTYAFCDPFSWIGKPSLTSIKLPSSITSIGSYAFSARSGLTSVTIPDLVTSIGYGAFWSCISLTSVTIPAAVTTIGSNAFSNCSALTSITIPSSVTSIGDAAFENCSSLTSVTIPYMVTSIGNYAFYGCYGLTSFTIPASVTSIGSSAFNSCSGLTSITIPASVISIGSDAFSGCRGLSSVMIPASVTSIGDLAFGNFDGLIIVDESNSNYSSVDGILFNKARTVIKQCPVSKKGNFIIPASVTSIGNSAFESCSGLTSVTIPVSVTSIGNSAFEFCRSLTSVTIPVSVTSIGDDAFKSCSSLTSVMIPASVTSIGTWAFDDCSSLTSVSIPASVTSIGGDAFAYCDALSSIFANAVTPVNISSKSTVFFNVNKTTCILYVPKGSKSAYQEAEQWRDFTNIVEMTTGLIDQFANEPIIHSQNGALCIENVEVYSLVKVYDITGRIRYSGEMLNSSMNIVLTKNSIYLVQINDEIYKIKL